MTEAIQVVTTTGNAEDAQRIASVLIERRLAACVQVGGPMTSCYRWQGKVETDTEWTCTAKTLLSVYPQVEAAIGELHPYDEPEIIAMPIVAGSAGYLRWLAEQIDNVSAD